MKGSFDLSGHVALITGAARGLGFEMARAMGAAGAVVYVNGSHIERACDAVERLKAENIQAFPSVFDVRDERAGEAAVAEIFAQHERLDILVNNVGMRFREPLDRIGSAEIKTMLDTNVVAAFALAKVCTAIMMKQRYGRIINVSSISSERARAGDAAYLVSKGALNALTRALAAEFGQYGITCNTLVPGTFLTEVNAERFASPAMQEWFKTRTLLQRVGQPWEIGGAALFLASPASTYVTGVSLPVDGGYWVAG